MASVCQYITISPAFSLRENVSVYHGVMKKLPLALSAALLSGMAAADEQAGPLIDQLKSGDFRVRESAYRVLQTKTDPDTLKKLEAATKSADVETARRAADILRPHRERVAHTAAEKAIEEHMERIMMACDGILPSIGVSGLDGDGQRFYFDKAKGVPRSPGWGKLRDASRLYFLDLLRRGHTDLMPLVEKMKAEETLWQGQLGLPPTWSK